MEINEDKEIIISRDHFITSAQKIVFLKYMQFSADFISKPRNHPKLLNLLIADHNKVCESKENEDIVRILELWVGNVRSRFNEMITTRKSFAFPSEDIELISLLKADKQKSNLNEFSCILDHLEIAHSSPKFWLTIALEMESFGTKKDENYWKNTFEKWCNKVKRKQQILDQMELQEADRNSFLSSLELRALQVLGSIEAEEKKKDNTFCRVCLQSKDENLRNIHEVLSDDMTPAQKISQCANVEEVSDDDNLPQFICENCNQMLEMAYKFKTLCEYSDQQLRLLVKRSNIEYEELLLEEGDEEEYQVQTIEEELEEIDDNGDENHVEMKLCFENGELVTEGSIIESEMIDENSATDGGGVINVAEDVDVHQCKFCSIICYNKDTLRKHMNTHTISRHHPCEVCQKEFRTKLALKIHMRSHTGERPYVCDVCGKAFTQDATLSYHRAIHTGSKPYHCTLCAYQARNVNDLKIHMRKHTGARPYKCKLCPSAFTTSSNLQKHIRRHTGIKNFQTCGKAFKTWSAVTTHRTTHASDKTIHCQHCSYKTTTIANLKIHNRTHTGIQPYQCSQCPLKFSTASNRLKHVKNVHEKLKTHKCTTCSRTFFSRESARKHMVIHTGLKPYNCLECTVSYGWYNGLQKHMKTQHPGVKMPTEKHFLDLMDKET